MGLEITILGADGAPIKTLSIGVDDHYHLMQLIGANGGFLGRLNDYYSDAAFEYSELEELAEEIRTIHIFCKDAVTIASFLNDFLELIKEAKQIQKPLFAIAD
jgi:hypothetical protein